ncbi:response regulator [Dyadobacter luticola]|uniref:Response regulator n=1 Tax=Dyadobacter luticola TaxID=1979387 RepID=A0A5R9L576_9BACT|nr:response regulator [Dyadobacter luticola]TLV03415.1 response regulator [Dyadobacter luticola]
MTTQRKEIYIVEDSPDFRHLVRSIFKKFLPEYDIRFFQGGSELYQFIILQSTEEYSGKLPGLIIMDLELPTIDGFEMIKLLRRSPSNKATAWNTIPIVVLSNNSTQADIDKAYRSSVNSFFIKPVDFDELRLLLETICRYWIDYNRLALPDQETSELEEA